MAKRFPSKRTRQPATIEEARAWIAEMLSSGMSAYVTASFYERRSKGSHSSSVEYRCHLLVDGETRFEVEAHTPAKLCELVLARLSAPPVISSTRRLESTTRRLELSPRP